MSLLDETTYILIHLIMIIIPDNYGQLFLEIIIVMLVYHGIRWVIKKRRKNEKRSRSH